MRAPSSIPYVVGYASEVDGSAEPRRPGWRETRLGGAPVWPPGVDARECPKCEICARQCVLVIQAFAPTELNPDRVLFVFGCNSARCSENPKAWSVWRYAFSRTASSVIHSSDGGRREVGNRNLAHARNVSGELSSNCSPSPPSRDSTFPGTSRPAASDTEGSDSDSSDDLVRMQELLKLRKLQIDERIASTVSQPAKKGARNCERGEPVPQIPDESEAETVRHGPWLSLVPIEVDHDTQPHGHDANLDSHVERLLADYAAKEEEEGRQQRGHSDGCDPEGEEISSPSSLALEAFSACLDRAPGHVVRYRRGGEAVWPTHPSPPHPPSCPSCGGPRAFEMQLMPTALHYLDVDMATSATESTAGMNWATVAVYTCLNDCVGHSTSGPSGLTSAWAREAVHVAPDEF